MIDIVLDTIHKYNMINKGDKIIVGVSGGPDSMCLLHILYRLKDNYDLDIIAAHINHCLRGEEANNDEKYVESFCEERDIEFHSIRINVQEIAKKENVSFEVAGRKCRYDFFNKLKLELNADKIALAHNSNDQCETILMRIMRGTGIEGLAGIKAIRDNIYIRPIIEINREQIENYCEENQLNPRIDKTNLESIYTRNKIRLELIPYIQENFNKDIISVINRMGENIDVDREYLDLVSHNKFYEFCTITKGKVIIKKEAFLEHKAIVSRIIRKSINALKGSLYNFERIHVEDILNLQKGTTGKVITLPQQIRALNNYGDIHVFFEKASDNRENNKDIEYILKIGSNTIGNNAQVKLELINEIQKDGMENNTYVKYFDFDKINGNIMFRYRKNGDRFTPLGMKGSKKIKDLFIDFKIPKHLRDYVPLICFGDEIAWIVGYRISEKFKVDKSTRNILKIKIEGEKENELV
ncbi:tRNA lysidine(34) synthetase TilS [Clostridium cochlearium]|uniref:tRNA(Ile)-lysidine synthase n=1 Tax=Clostridium cochlearium TaxID=1494 RepID=A0A240B210_CLOCO|nr:tRNA lysidine(34) synthetase TilS [Clostridium cochlearium]MBE6065545.1 tRNA lysidine(34) synthetase TilS [Clostridium cochlearium]MBU5270012.1 tRNA lysidine(34) synthetase TilS [Clostridium cochlearium]MDU1444062.1 tRNA lysidine(34) synthetase TilS [Clostridium cochlearium]NMA57504.1 tRNA lysidine(34) synthetase TilS [Clostridium cochlearium]NME95084.1 tRNA lysidine(34) synthetase TilS [Clostridium cochlearium]